MDVKPKVMKAVTAAIVYDTERETLLKYRHEGKIEGKQVGKHMYFNVKDLDRLFAI